MHDSEHTRVWVDFRRDGSFQIDVLGDPVWFLDRLDRLTGLPLSGPLEGDARDRRMEELTPIFSEWIWLFFDGQRLKVEAEFIPADPNVVVNPDWPPLATMRLSGAVPPGAQTFSFAYGLVQDDYPIRMEGSDGKPIVRWVRGDLESERWRITDVTPPSPWRIAGDYAREGFLHVVPGSADQILFAVALCLLGAGLGAALTQASLVVIGQTLALGLAAFGFLSLRAGIVGPLVALSVGYVAAENLFSSELRTGRLALVFAFGLVQGAGFALALARFGLPESNRTVAALAFNLGVVAAEAAVIALALAGSSRLRARPDYRGRALVPLSLAIAGIAAYWTVSRIAGG